MSQKVERVCAFGAKHPALPGNPLRVRSAGVYEVPGGWSEPVVTKWFVELTWGISGEGEALAGGRYVQMLPGDLLLYSAGDAHHLRAKSGRWRYGWITFDHPEIEKWLAGFRLRDRKRNAGACPEQVFLEVVEALRDLTPDGERLASARAYEILLLASSTPRAPSTGSLSDRAKLLIDESFMDAGFTVSEMSDRLGVHRSTLFRHFTESYGHTPSAYLLNVRLTHGLHRLQNSNDPVQEVALQAGFTDAGYFARAVRKATGKSPREFRPRERRMVKGGRF